MSKHQKYKIKKTGQIHLPITSPSPQSIFTFLSLCLLHYLPEKEETAGQRPCAQLPENPHLRGELRVKGIKSLLKCKRHRGVLTHKPLSFINPTTHSTWSIPNFSPGHSENLGLIWDWIGWGQGLAGIKRGGLDFIIYSILRSVPPSTRGSTLPWTSLGNPGTEMSSASSVSVWHLNPNLFVLFGSRLGLFTHWRSRSFWSSHLK